MDSADSGSSPQPETTKSTNSGSSSGGGSFISRLFGSKSKEKEKKAEEGELGLDGVVRSLLGLSLNRFETGSSCESCYGKLLHRIVVVNQSCNAMVLK